MIRANELRIGNWVLDGDTYLQVAHYDISDCFYESNGWHKIAPIPLTPEILEKCGFDVQDDSIAPDCRKGDFRISFAIHDGVLEYAGVRIYEYIPSLHQLQNLYFALTGQELNIQL